MPTNKINTNSKLKERIDILKVSISNYSKATPFIFNHNVFLFVLVLVYNDINHIMV